MEHRKPGGGVYRQRILFLLLACVSAAALSVLTSPPGHAHEDDGGVVVHVTDEGFEPKSVEVGSGDTVVFENVGGEAHWPASDDHPTHTRYPEFDPLGPIEPGAEWSFAFDKPGEWGYHDHQNPYLTGKVVVRDEESSGLDGLFASVKTLFSGAYAATISLFAPQEEEDGHQKEKDEYVALVRDQDPKAALGRLREEIETDDGLASSCHDLTHEIGREAYEKYRDFSEAMQYQDEVCNSGYLHGIIEERFAGSDDVFAAMETTCDGYEPVSFLGFQCYHGVGHGAMYYTSNDLPRSLEMCDVFGGSSARSNCANGVFMENFSADQKLHTSEYLSEEDPFYPCAEQAERDKADCYLYAPTYYLNLNKEDYAGALAWCDGAEDGFETACARGVGAQTMKENINDPGLVESVCTGGTSERVAPCIEGMVGLYINHYGSLEPARTLCGQLEASNRKTCRAWVKSNSKLFDG